MLATIRIRDRKTRYIGQEKRFIWWLFIKYDAVKPTPMCMLKGTPLSTDNINIEKDIERVYNISAKRLYKNCKQLYTKLLTFTSEKEQSGALKGNTPHF